MEPSSISCVGRGLRSDFWIVRTFIGGMKGNSLSLLKVLDLFRQVFFQYLKHMGLFDCAPVHGALLVYEIFHFQFHCIPGDIILFRDMVLIVKNSEGSRCGIDKLISVVKGLLTHTIRKVDIVIN